MKGQFYIKQTEDGSSTLYKVDIDEHYHSYKGALSESEQVFIHYGLDAVARKEEIRVLEVGFGTGLNACLSLEWAEVNQQRVHYTAIELFPLEWDLVRQLGYEVHLPPSIEYLFQKMHLSPWGQEGALSSYFTIVKHNDDFISTSFDSLFDVVYFDPFSPEKHPQMWSREQFQKLYQAMSPLAVLTTYCAKGEVRRTLESIGFSVERLPGPSLGKREVLRAAKK